MKNAHIAFVSLPVASHLNPTLPIVAALVRRGHRVTFAASDPFHSRIKAVGADVIGFRSFTIRNDTKFCLVATNTLASITPILESNRPDLIVYDFLALAGQIVARKWGIPAIRTSPHFAVSRRTVEQQVWPAAYRELAIRDSARADQFLQQHGVHGSDLIFDREKLNIYTFPREFEPCPEAIDETCLHVGRSAGEQAGFGDWQRQERVNSGPVVLVAPSRAYAQGEDYFRMCIDAYSGFPGHVIFSIYDDTDVSALSPLPANIELVRGTSSVKILPHVDLVVSMGGTGTASEAAYHGVPHVITSLGFAELEWLGDNLARLGIGIHLKGAGMKATAVRAATMEALGSTRIANCAKQLQRAVRRQPGAEEAANCIEDYLEGARSSH